MSRGGPRGTFCLQGTWEPVAPSYIKQVATVGEMRFLRCVIVFAVYVLHCPPDGPLRVGLLPPVSKERWAKRHRPQPRMVFHCPRFNLLPSHFHSTDGVLCVFLHVCLASVTATLSPFFAGFSCSWSAFS